MFNSAASSDANFIYRQAIKIHRKMDGKEYERNAHSQAAAYVIYDMIHRTRVNLDDICEECKKSGKTKESSRKFMSMTHRLRDEAFRTGKKFVSRWTKELESIEPHISIGLEDYILLCEYRLNELTENHEITDEERTDMKDALRYSRMTLDIAHHLKAMRGACENRMCKLVREYLKYLETTEREYHELVRLLE